MSDSLTEAGLLFYMYLCQVRQLSEYGLTSTSDQGDKITLVFLGKYLASTNLQKWQHSESPYTLLFPSATCTLSTWKHKEKQAGGNLTKQRRSGVMPSSNRSLCNHVWL